MKNKMFADINDGDFKDNLLVETISLAYIYIYIYIGDLSQIQCV